MSVVASAPFIRTAARRGRRRDRLFGAANATAVCVILVMLAIVLGDVVRGGAGALSWTFLSSFPEHGMTGGGVFPAIVGTVELTFLMTVAVVPVGVVTAVYLTEYAPAGSWITQLVRTSVANLAGVPSIVFGLFGLGFFIATIGRGIDAAAYGGQVVFGKPSLLWGALTMAVLTLPVVVVTTEEALRAVPRDLRDASLALGGTRFQTVTRVVLPQAMGGVLTGAILAVSRGAGEVAPLLFTGAAYYLPELSAKLHEPFMALGYHVYVLATQSPDVDRTKPLLYATALVLLALTFLLNLVAVLIRVRLRSAHKPAA